MDNRKTIKTGVPRQLAEELDRLAPTLITVPGARYRLEQVVGRGSLFVTFRATRIDQAGAVPHAVKVLRPSLARAWPAGTRVLSREQARVLAILNERVPPCPNVVRLLEIVELEADGLTVPFFALEWIDDELPSLFDRVRAAVTTVGVGLDPRTALQVLDGVARGLDWIHQHGLLHRGLAPTNVLVTGREVLTAKISDVAIARPTGLPASFGAAAEVLARSTEPYRAPEQHQERSHLTPACDVFALGALSRFVLTGRAISNAQPLARCDSVHPGFAGTALAELDAALATLTAFDPEERPPTIETAWRLLEGPLRDLSARTVPPQAPKSAAPASPSWVWTERHRPERPRALTAIAVDPEGHALAVDRPGRPHDEQLVYFDGRSYRTPPPCAERATVTALAAMSPGAFLVGGHTRRGAARVFRLDTAGFTRLPLDATGTVLAVQNDRDGFRAFVRSGDEVAMIDLAGRVDLPGLRSVDATLVLGTMLVIVGEGGSFTFDTETRVARPHRLPIRSATAAASNVLAGEDGALLTVELVARHRTVVARDQIPGVATALSVLDDTSLFIAIPGEVLVREGGRTRSLFREDGAAPCLSLAPRRRGLLLFLRDGRVLEGRALGAASG